MRGVLDLMFANMRVPRERRGDFMSTWGTCKVAERRIREIASKYGLATVRAATGRLLDRAERRMRARIAALPDGEYAYEHYLDPPASGADPVKACATIEVHGDSLTVDLAGSSAPSLRPRQQRPRERRDRGVHRAQDLPRPRAADQSRELPPDRRAHPRGSF